MGFSEYKSSPFLTPSPSHDIADLNKHDSVDEILFIPPLSQRESYSNPNNPSLQASLQLQSGTYLLQKKDLFDNVTYTACETLQFDSIEDEETISQEHLNNLQLKKRRKLLASKSLDSIREDPLSESILNPSSFSCHSSSINSMRSVLLGYDFKSAVILQVTEEGLKIIAERETEL